MDGLAKWLKGNGLPEEEIIVGIAVFVMALIGFYFYGTFAPSLQYVFLFLPYAIPFMLAPLLWHAWIKYIQSAFIAKQKYVTLEVKIPRDITQTPLAMEVVLAAFHNGSGESTWYDRNWLGKLRPYSSLELISDEGRVRFMIWCRAGLKNIIEAQIYSQYPGIEIVEVPDYAADFEFHPDTVALWGNEYAKGDSMPNAFPIKTYIDFGLDKASDKEELKIDPIATIIEWLAAKGPGEHAWIQFVIRVHKGSWKKDGEELVDKILLRDPKTKEPAKLSATGFPIMATLSKLDVEKTEAIVRSGSKAPFDCGIRALYWASPGDKFNGTNVPWTLGLMRAFSAGNLNSLGPKNTTSFDYPWEDYKNIRLNKKKAEIVDAYKRRQFFYSPHDDRAKSVLNTEEIATLYHFPGAVVQAPGLVRVESKKSEAPSNLPI